MRDIIILILVLIVSILTKLYIENNPIKINENKEYLKMNKTINQIKRKLENE